MLLVWCVCVCVLYLQSSNSNSSSSSSDRTPFKTSSPGTMGTQWALQSIGHDDINLPMADVIMSQTPQGSEPTRGFGEPGLLRIFNLRRAQGAAKEFKLSPSLSRVYCKLSSTASATMRARRPATQAYNAQVLPEHAFRSPMAHTNPWDLRSRQLRRDTGLPDRRQPSRMAFGSDHCQHLCQGACCRCPLAGSYESLCVNHLHVRACMPASQQVESPTVWTPGVPVPKFSCAN